MKICILFSVRLVSTTQYNNNNTVVGVLKVFLNNYWHSIIATDFDDVAAGVACRRMGYNYYRALMPRSFLRRQSMGRRVVLSTNCTGTESSLSECSLQAGEIAFRFSRDYASVVCSKVALGQGEFI